MISTSISNISNKFKAFSIWRKLMVGGCLLIICMSTIYYFIGRKSLSQESVKEHYSSIEAVATVGELLDGSELRQTMKIHSNYLRGITIRFANYGNIPSGSILLEIRDNSGNLLASANPDVNLLENNKDYYFTCGEPVFLDGENELVLIIKSEGGEHNSALTLWAGIEQEDCLLTLNGTHLPNTLYMDPDGYNEKPYDIAHWGFTAFLIILLIVFCLHQEQIDDGQRVGFREFIHIFDEYPFLLRQLVSVDFKNKYRRSYLGVLWSLLNPLLMMAVMSVIFSVVFRFNNTIPYFQLYLILGQVLFSFYGESTQLCLTSIVGSGQLIKKVYLPKFIFPLSKTIFALINTSISFIAVFIVMVFYRVPFTINILYLPLIIGSYFLFCLGVGIILSALMVFVRDTQHLYSIFLTILGYLTPIFYSIDMFPDIMRKILKLNPLYHYITAVRTILQYGQPLPLKTSAICIFLGVISLALGIKFFSKREPKFILYM